MAWHQETQSSGQVAVPSIALGSDVSQEGEPTAGWSIAPTSLPQGGETPLVALGSVLL